MNECPEHALHEHRIKTLEDQSALDRAAIEENSKALEVHETKLESAMKSIASLERRLDEAEGEPARVLNAWKLAAVAALASLVVNAIVNGMVGR